MPPTTTNPTRHAWRILKPLTDALLVVVAFAIAYWVRYDLQWIRLVEPAYYVRFSVYLPSMALLTAITVGVYWLEGAYRPQRTRLVLDDFYIVLKGTLAGIALLTVIVFYARPFYYSRLIFGYAGVIILILVGASRAVEMLVVGARRRRGLGVTHLLIVGAGETARTIMRAVVARPDLGYEIVGFVDDDAQDRPLADIGRYPALGTTAALGEIVARQHVDEVVITLPWMSHRKILEITNQCARDRVRTRIVPDLFQMTLRNVVVEHINGVPLLGIAEPQLHDWQHLAKRVIDVLAAVVLMIVLAPLMAVVALAIRLDSPGPVFYRQKRLGRLGREFTCVKFRTMCENAEAIRDQYLDQNEATGPLFKIRNDPRRTRVGRVLRHGFDELPQLWNVLKGEMSLVGPRPPIPAEVDAYEPWHRRRLDVRPGITGLWQVSGRSNLSFDEMVLLDLYYIENWSPLLDLRILAKTIPVVLMGSGGY